MINKKPNHICITVKNVVMQNEKNVCFSGTYQKMVMVDKLDSMDAVVVAAAAGSLNDTTDPRESYYFSFGTAMALCTE